MPDDVWVSTMKRESRKETKRTGATRVRERSESTTGDAAAESEDDFDDIFGNESAGSCYKMLQYQRDLVRYEGMGVEARKFERDSHGGLRQEYNIPIMLSEACGTLKSRTSSAHSSMMQRPRDPHIGRGK